ncbi:MAG: diguanylate cyclase [Proteobacteria bacterium]|nr:diguanylate cyclase [Pseudomonadota bacterium]
MKSTAGVPAVITADDAGREVAVDLAAGFDSNSYGGVFVIVDGEGRVVEASPLAGPLAAVLCDGACGALSALIARVLAAGRACESVTIENGKTFDLVALPVANGGVMLVGREATLEHNLRDALIDSRGRYKELVECSTDFAWETERDGRFVFVSPRGFLGYSADELIENDPIGLLHERHDEPGPLPFHTRLPIEGAIVWLRAVNGAAARLETSCVPLFDKAGLWIGARGICRDVTAEWLRGMTLARARQRERLATHLVNAIREELVPEKLLARAAGTIGRALGGGYCAIYRVGVAGALEAASSYGAKPGEDLLARLVEAIDGMAAGRDSEAVRIAGSEVLIAKTTHGLGVNGAICVLRDAEGGEWSEDDHALMAGITGHLGIAIEQIAAHEALDRLARTDELTNLENRRAFMESAERRRRHAVRTGRPAAVLYTDLDNFKLVNDVYGHRRGDEALVAWAEALTRHTRANDVVGRLGGDEFALWLDEIGTSDAASKAAALIEAGAFLAGYSGDPERPVGLSVGVAAFDPAGGEDLESLLARADTAMYEAKHLGGSGFFVAPPWSGAGGAAS